MSEEQISYSLSLGWSWRWKSWWRWPCSWRDSCRREDRHPSWLPYGTPRLQGQWAGWAHLRQKYNQNRWVWVFTATRLQSSFRNQDEQWQNYLNPVVQTTTVHCNGCTTFIWKKTNKKTTTSSVVLCSILASSYQEPFSIIIYYTLSV